MSHGMLVWCLLPVPGDAAVHKCFIIKWFITLYISERCWDHLHHSATVRSSLAKVTPSPAPDWWNRKKFSFQRKIRRAVRPVKDFVFLCRNTQVFETWLSLCSLPKPKALSSSWLWPWWPLPLNHSLTCFSSSQSLYIWQLLSEAGREAQTLQVHLCPPFPFSQHKCCGQGEKYEGTLRSHFGSTTLFVFVHQLNSVSWLIQELLGLSFCSKDKITIC